MSNRFVDYLRALIGAMRADVPVYAFTAAYAVIGWVVLVRLGGEQSVIMMQRYAHVWLTQCLMLAPGAFMIAGVSRITLTLTRRRTLGYRAMLAPERVARFLAGTLLLVGAGLVFTSTFSALKTAISAHGFSFDQIQADIDKALHFGVDPWRWLYAVAYHPWLQRVLEFNYNTGWIIYCFSLLYWVSVSPRAEALRVRYYTCYFLAWIVVGNVLAGTFLSAGPAFFAQVTGDTARFAPQLDLLRSSWGELNSASTLQAYLWLLHTSGNAGIGSGISAFPSMHVAMVTLAALFVGELSRRWAIAAWAYVAVIMVSSVYLGWHYAIDGYVSVLVMTGLYWAVRTGLPQLARLRWRNPVPVTAAAG